MKKLLLICVLVASTCFGTISIRGSLTGLGNIQAAYRHNSTVFALSGNSLYSITDNPASPEILDTLTFSTYPLEMRFSDNTAYIVYGRTLQAVDISNPSVLSAMSSVDLPNYGYDIAIYRNYIYVATLEQMTIIEVSGSGHLSISGNIPSYGAQCKAAAIWNNKLIMGRSESGIYVYDLTTPDSPSLEGLANTPGWALDIETSGNSAFIADGNDVVESRSSIVSIDLSSAPMYPVVDTLYSPTGTCLEGVIALENYYILADGPGGIKVIDISTPSSLRVVDSTILMGSGTINNVDFHDGTIYASSNGTLYFLESSVITAPVDVTPPTVTNIAPTSTASACPSQPIKFIVHDASGINRSTIRVNIDGITMTESDLSIRGDTVSYTPMIEWMPARTIEWSFANVCDAVGNCLSSPVRGSFLIDTEAPAFSDIFPASGSIVSVPNPLVRVRITDTGSGINPASLNVNYTVSGIPYSCTYPGCISGDGTYATFAGMGPFSDGDTVMVNVIAADRTVECGPNMSNTAFVFYVVIGGADVTPPVATVNSPVDGSFSSIRTQQTSFSIIDPSGVDPSTIRLSVNGSTMSVDGTSLSYTGTNLVYYPGVAWTEGILNTISLTQYGDSLGNTSTTPVTTRFTGDYSAPSVSGTFPAHGDTNVSLTSSIQVFIIDRISGVLRTGINMTINGESVTPVVSVMPGDTGIIITYVPSEAYPDTAITVRISNVTDKVTFGAPNVMAPYTFRFNDPEGIKENAPRSINANITAHPNPFNGSLTVSLGNSEKTRGTINVFDVLGNHIAILTDGIIESNHIVSWTPDNLPAGLYYIYFKDGNSSASARVLYVK
jgi:hypothetical protein